MRTYNFGAGPAMLPLEILEQAKAELLDWNNTGMSIMEIGHRTKWFSDLLEDAENDLRQLLNVPSNYHVLFMTCPTRGHFAMVPLNLLGDKTTADYIDTGIWSNMSMNEAKRYCTTNCVASAEISKHTAIPEKATWKLDNNAAYVHYTDNETINGLEFAEIPDVGNVPLVVDMTSNFLSKPLDISRFGVIYSGAQKNVSPAGLTIVIIRNDLLNKASPLTPSVFNYTLFAETRSMYCTPNTFSCYMASLMFKWLIKEGGVTEMAKRSLQKSQNLYKAIDQSNGFYSNPIALNSRSRMNIPFRIHDEKLEPVFISEAAKAGFSQLQGHKVVGGLRASLYNAMPETGVNLLIEFMNDFTKRHG